MERHLYESFVHIVEQQTLSKAAEAAHLTQPTLTRHVQQLEAELGMPLFERTGKRLVLNRAGELVYRYAKRALALDQKLVDELRSYTDPEAGAVYIAAGLTPAIYLLPPWLATYRSLHPGVRFDVSTGSSAEVYNRLMHREVDIGIVTTLESSQDVDAVPLVRDELLAVVSPVHPLAGEGPLEFARLTDHPFVVMREGSGLRKLVDHIAREGRGQVSVALETDSLESMNRFVQLGLGVAILPRSCVQEDIVLGRLVVVQLEQALPHRTVTLITRVSSQLPACASRFVDQLHRVVHPSTAGMGP